MDEIKQRLLASPLDFTRTFFKIKTGRDFQISCPTSRESHMVTIYKALKRVFDGECKRLIINVPPRYGKTISVIHFVAWALAHYPDSNFIYCSYAKSLSKLQTQTIREIISLPQYKHLFGVTVAEDTSAKDDFMVSGGGSVFAAGVGGPITGRGAGLKNVERFGGAILLDDLHKPIEVASDTMRQSVIDWYSNTLASRTNDKNTPIVFIGQRLHEDDLPAHLLATNDWEVVSLQALDGAGNALYPEMHDVTTLEKMAEENPYVFAAQYQQNPQPAGGGIFKPEWFVQTDIEPHIVATFITADTAETQKVSNDATAFSFWGIYKIAWKGIDTGLYGLHWLDARELHVEPKDLETEFFSFYTDCMRYRVKPKVAVIERKSTGVTLTSVLKTLQGLRIIESVPTRNTGSKIDRFLACQSYVASKRISVSTNAAHREMVIEHCRKITSNNSHRRDDIADCLQMAIKTALMDELLIPRGSESENEILNELSMNMANVNLLKQKRYR